MRNSRWGSIILWILVMLGWLLPLYMVGSVLGISVFHEGPQEWQASLAIVVAVLVGGAAGIVIGRAQWWLLRDRTPRMRGCVFGTAAGAALSGALMVIAG